MFAPERDQIAAADIVALKFLPLFFNERVPH